MLHGSGGEEGTQAKGSLTVYSFSKHFVPESHAGAVSATGLDKALATLKWELHGKSELGRTGRAVLAGHGWGMTAPSHGSVQSQPFQHFITHMLLALRSVASEVAFKSIFYLYHGRKPSSSFLHLKPKSLSFSKSYFLPTSLHFTQP